MRDFDTLTAAGQVQRLAQVARNALVQYDMPGASVKALATSYNTLFRVRWRGQSFVCRISPRIGVHAAGVAEAERAWTTRMAAGGGPVPVVVPTADGAASAVVALGGVPGPRTCTLLTWLPGSPLSRPGHTVTERTPLTWAAWRPSCTLSAVTPTPCPTGSWMAAAY